MVERRTIDQRLEALRERNKRYYDELRGMIGEDGRRIFHTKNGRLVLKLIHPKEVNSLIRIIAEPKDLGFESYLVDEIGLLRAAVFGGSLRVRTKLGVDHRFKRVKRAEIDARDVRYTFKFCNQIENIVNSIKDQIDVENNA